MAVAKLMSMHAGECRAIDDHLPHRFAHETGRDVQFLGGVAGTDGKRPKKKGGYKATRYPRSHVLSEL